MAGACAGHGASAPFRDWFPSYVNAVERPANYPQAPVAPAPPPDLVGRYCVSCHNDRLKTGGLSLQNLALADVPAHAGCVGKRRPQAAVRRDAAVDGAARGLTRGVGSVRRLSGNDARPRGALEHPHPGRAPVHRLNRAEYSNAVRDLLAVDVRPGEWLPVDDSGYGFDNIAAVLSTSPALLDRYMSAARKVSRLAVGDLTLKPVEEIYDAKRDPDKGVRNEQLNDDLPFDSRAGMSVSHYFPLDAEYVFKVRVLGVQADGERGRDQPVSSARGGEGRPAHGGRDVAARESEGRTRRARRQAAGGRASATQIPSPVDLRLDGARLKRFDVVGTARRRSASWSSAVPTSRPDAARRRAGARSSCAGRRNRPRSPRARERFSTASRTARSGVR